MVTLKDKIQLDYLNFESVQSIAKKYNVPLYEVRKHIDQDLINLAKERFDLMFPEYVIDHIIKKEK